MKVIKVTGCHDCPYYRMSVFNGTIDHSCHKIGSDGMSMQVSSSISVKECVANKTIHPDCPLNNG